MSGAEIIDLSSDSEEDVNKAPAPAAPPAPVKVATNIQLPKLQNLAIAKKTTTSTPTQPQEKPTKKNQKAVEVKKQLAIRSQFMADFDPYNSKRERRKLSKKFSDVRPTAHDENGIIVGTDMDLCDCLVESCAGCFFPCPQCRHCKCGVECRNSRKHLIEAVENEADNKMIRNPAILRLRMENESP